jgi:indolepyruvate ferredoxin oxidoreductase alpha subunit
VRTIDPFDQKTTLAVLKEEIERDAPSVVITTKPCVLFPSKLKAAAKFQVILEKCTACGACFRIGCPAITASSEKNEKGRAKSQIDLELCTGCTLCAQVCPEEAIQEVKK